MEIDGFVMRIYNANLLDVPQLRFSSNTTRTNITAGSQKTKCMLTKKKNVLHICADNFQISFVLYFIQRKSTIFTG